MSYYLNWTTWLIISIILIILLILIPITIPPSRLRSVMVAILLLVTIFAIVSIAMSYVMDTLQYSTDDYIGYNGSEDLGLELDDDKIKKLHKSGDYILDYHISPYHNDLIILRTDDQSITHNRLSKPVTEMYVADNGSLSIRFDDKTGIILSLASSKDSSLEDNGHKINDSKQES